MTEISKEEVQGFHEEYLQALKAPDIAPLERILLPARPPSGGALNKKEIPGDPFEGKWANHKFPFSPNAVDPQ